MMECNREEALRARRIALKKLENKDYFGARKIALQAQRLYPELENLSQLITVCEVYCAAEAKINRNMDWYGILKVEVTADDTIIAKQYEKLAFWLHPSKNSFPGAEAAFKLVSEAHAILCDHVKRSQYDIKRQYTSREVARNATRLSGKTHANKSYVVGRIPPYDFTMVFWTICPHCQKRFVYYQRNFLVSCDDCGKNFFAFKLCEEAVPSRFLSAAPNNSRVLPEMRSHQQHGAPNQHVQCTELHTTGENMDSIMTVHAMQNEHIEMDGRSDGNRESNSSETRSNVVQLSAVNKTHSPSTSAVECTTESMMPYSPYLNIVATQNLSSEDAFAVLNVAGSCSLERAGKRKQDDCADKSNSRDSYNNKRQRAYSSLSDSNSGDAKMLNDNVASADNKSAEHFSNKVDSQEERDSTLEGNPQQYTHDNIGIGNQISGNPMSNHEYECPDFFDFGELRNINRLEVGQIWALYDDLDFMPRVYAQINHVDAFNLKVQLTWLVHNAMNEEEAKWIRKELSVACGNFCSGETYVLQDPSMYLSHRVSWTKGKNRNSFDIHPKKGEVWALYKESIMLSSSDTNNRQLYSFDVVEVINDSTSIGVIVSPLVRIEGFVSLFAEARDKSRILIPSSEFLRFSHSIPFYRTNGNERAGVAEGLLELDTAALPSDLAAAFPAIDMNSRNKKRDTELVVVTYPDSEFHNFDEDRACEKFERGQIWALYSDSDTLPNLYGWVSKVEREPFKVHLTWLKACPQEAEKLWLEQDMTMSCGNFEIQNSTTMCDETCAFSHLVETIQIGIGRRVQILPKVGEVWVIYKSWPPDWTPNSNNHRAEYAIGQIIKRTEDSMLFAFLTKIDGHMTVFKHDVQKGVLKIPLKENMRFSHRVPSFRLTKENDGKLDGFYELDPAALPDVFL